MRPNPAGIARFTIALLAIILCIAHVALAPSPIVAVVWAATGVVWAVAFFVVLDTDKQKKARS